MSSIWRGAVLDALHRFSVANDSRIITRQNLIHQELDRIILATDTISKTPQQSISKALQELRDQGLIEFSDNAGTYYLIDEALDVELEDLPDEVLDSAILKNRLNFEMVATSEAPAIARRRRGQDRVRTLTLQNYRNTCAMCDIKAGELLVASHIVRWADDPTARGNLTNVLCLCKPHDALFESGYLALTNDYEILKHNRSNSQFLASILAQTNEFHLPEIMLPDPKFLQQHRQRHNFPDF